MIHCPKNSDDGQGSDTYWDVYGRYSGEWNGIKLAGVAGWSAANGCKQEQTVSETVAVSGFNGSGCINSPFAAGPGAGGLNPANISGDVGYFQSGIYVEHVATGVWVLFNYGQEFLQDMPTGTNNFNTNFSVLNSDPYHWYLKAGLRERWTSLGHTALYGFYSERHDMIDAALVWNDNIVGAKTREWGLGVVQEVDAAAMSLWLQWDEMHATVSCGNAGGETSANGCATSVAGDGDAVNGLDAGLKDINVIKGGALINF